MLLLFQTVFFNFSSFLFLIDSIHNLLIPTLFYAIYKITFGLERKKLQNHSVENNIYLTSTLYSLKLNGKN